MLAQSNISPSKNKPLKKGRWIIDPILVTFGQKINFRDPNLVTFFKLKERQFTFHL